MESRTFIKEEVAQHNKSGDCWLIIEGKVYDASEFMADHPGGESFILDEGGKDASEAFEDAEHTKSAKNQLAKLCIGTLI